MQVLFFMGLIGLFFASVAGIISTVAETTMARKLDQVALVEEMFQDVDFVLNKRLLAAYADPQSFDDSFDAETMLEEEDIRRIFTEASPWDADSLQNDPWNRPIRVVAVTEQRVIAPNVTAPVTAVALVSEGPDRRLSDELESDLSTVGNQYREVLRLFPPDNSDDIVYTFSTQGAAEETWNDLKGMIDKVASLALFQYRQQLEAFQPTINQYYEDNAQAIVDNDLSDEELATAWMRGFGTVDPLPVATAGYPQMPIDLRQIGGDVEIKNVVPELEVAATQPGCSTPANCRRMVLFVNKTNQDSDWLVTYQRVLDGETLLR